MDNNGFAHLLDAWLAGQCGATSAATLPQALAQTQLKLLNEVLEYARARSSFYARHLASLQLPLTSLDQLATVPSIGADEVRNWGGLCCISQGEVERMLTARTSGTTGPPKRLAFSRADLERTAAFFRIGMRQLLSPGQRLAVLLPGGDKPFGVADLLARALTPPGQAFGLKLGGAECRALPDHLAKQLMDASLPVSGPVSGSGTDPAAYLAECAAWLRDYAPHVLVTEPTQLRKLLTVFAKTAPPDLRAVLSSGDILDQDLQMRIRETWRCQLVNHYGLSECGFGGAVECLRNDGKHLRALDLYPEIVDPETGLPLPPETPGEIVITTLRAEAMPLIRYRTGDVGSLLTRPCACGSPLPRLGEILGRLDRSGTGNSKELRIVRPQKAGNSVRPGL